MKAIALLLSLGFAAQVSAAEPPASDYGSRADATAPGRLVKLKADTRNIHVQTARRCISSSATNASTGTSIPVPAKPYST